LVDFLTPEHCTILPGLKHNRDAGVLEENEYAQERAHVIKMARQEFDARSMQRRVQSEQCASTPNGANLSTPDITGQSTKYALNRIYRISDPIKPADKTARKKRPIFQRFYPTVISVQNLAAPKPLEVVC